MSSFVLRRFVELVGQGVRIDKGFKEDHPKDAEYLNTPIENYLTMQIIFGNGQATGRFAMGSNDPLGEPSIYGQGAAVVEDEGGSGMKSKPINLDGADAESSKTAAGSKLSEEKGKAPVTNLKRKRTYVDDYIVMLGMTEAVNNVATALQAPQHNEVHLDLYSSVMSAPGHSEDALMFALCHLLNNKAEGLCFVQMTESHRVLWLRTYLAKHYY
ncbi:hypothetical protein QOZ80_6AG0516760 [Eleusine coracana subsp. coracana]|nr:hypothetical protein QOZ80_6AG0516760 [Eleusine coracana subsp. coracana]